MTFSRNEHWHSTVNQLASSMPRILIGLLACAGALSCSSRDLSEGDNDTSSAVMSGAAIPLESARTAIDFARGRFQYPVRAEQRYTIRPILGRSFVDRFERTGAGRIRPVLQERSGNGIISARVELPPDASAGRIELEDTATG